CSYSTEWEKKRERIGLGLVGFGAFFILFGMLLYFDSVLLAFGNILFLSGLVFIIGFRRTFTFFFQRQKLKGTSFFLGGGPHRPHALADPGHAAGGLRLRQPLQVCPGAPGCHGTGWGQRQIHATSICQGMKHPAPCWPWPRQPPQPS
uniref:Golgi transport 1A n=1 Tax=Anas platyrhynchos platyrhynchos TaxID=8840 RepID=A0A493T300_ANAPP